jgi:hypothetical protein
MLLFLLLAQLGDAATFMVGHSAFGMRLEANGFARAASLWAGADGVLLLKGAGILVTIAVLVASAGRFPRLVVWGAAAATSVGLLGIVTNVRSLVALGV